MKIVMKAEREGAYAWRVSQGISLESWPRDVSAADTPLQPA
jgi:hypothetical protein